MAMDIQPNTEQPGPSGVTSDPLNNAAAPAGAAVKHEYYSDYESDDSVQIIDVPKRVPDVIVLSDSDEETSSSQKTKTGLGKGKNNRTSGLTKDQEIRSMLESKNLFGEKDSNSPTWKGSKDTTCAVCLSDFEDRTFCDSCYHCFCYACILQWSKVVRTCPLCKTPFKVLIHKITANLTFRLHKFEVEDAKSATQQFLTNNRSALYNELMADGRRFRYRSTRTRDGAVENSTNRAPRYRSNAQSAKNERRRRQANQAAMAEERRREVYSKNLKLVRLEQRGRPRYRETSVGFFRDNPAVKYRIVPWLLRDLNVLLGKPHVSFVMNYILALLDRIEISSTEFREQLSQFLFDKAEQFAEELYNFARSPYDVQAFDDNAVYESPSQGNSNGRTHLRMNPIERAQPIFIPQDDGVDSSITLSSDGENPKADPRDGMFPFGSTRPGSYGNEPVTLSSKSDVIETAVPGCSTEIRMKTKKKKRKDSKHKTRTPKIRRDALRFSSTTTSEAGNTSPSNSFSNGTSDTDDLRDSLNRVKTQLHLQDNNVTEASRAKKLSGAQYISSGHKLSQSKKENPDPLYEPIYLSKSIALSSDEQLSGSSVSRKHKRRYNHSRWSREDSGRSESKTKAHRRISENRTCSSYYVTDSDSDTPSVALRSVVHVVNNGPGPSRDITYPSSHSSNQINDQSPTRSLLVNEIKDLERRISENRKRLKNYN